MCLVLKEIMSPCWGYRVLKGAPWQAWISSQSPPPHLARCFDTFPDAKVDNSENQHDAEGKLPADAPQVLESL